MLKIKQDLWKSVKIKLTIHQNVYSDFTHVSRVLALNKNIAQPSLRGGATETRPEAGILEQSSSITIT